MTENGKIPPVHRAFAYLVQNGGESLAFGMYSSSEYRSHGAFSSSEHGSQMKRLSDEVFLIPVNLFAPPRYSFHEAANASLAHLYKMAKYSKIHKKCLWLWERDNPISQSEHNKNFNRPHNVLARMNKLANLPEGER